MKYIFIYNPNAGKLKRNATFKKDLEELKTLMPEQIIAYETQGPNDATVAAKKFCEEYVNEKITIFACGGDGTMYEVLNGIVGYKNCNFGVIPTGSCNDFLKTFPHYNFLNLKKMVNGKVMPCDVLKVNDKYCLNVTNIGFDAKVNDDQIKFRATHKSVTKAYNHAIIKNLFSGEFDHVVIRVDGLTVYKGDLFLCALGNARYYGGGYKCCPKAQVNDGLTDLFMVKRVSIPRFAALIGPFKAGLIFNKPSDIHLGTRGREIYIRSLNKLTYCIDGETYYGNNLKITNLYHEINLVLPN